MKIRLLIELSRIPLIGLIFRGLLLCLGLQVPKSVKLGKRVLFEHYGMGTVLHTKTIIEDDVRIYHGVTIGRGDVHIKSAGLEGFIIRSGAILCAGAKIIGTKGTLVIGENAIIAANAVVLSSVGKNEIWGGIPAKKIGVRSDFKSL